MVFTSNSFLCGDPHADAPDVMKHNDVNVEFHATLHAYPSGAGPEEMKSIEEIFVSLRCDPRASGFDDMKTNEVNVASRTPPSGALHADASVEMKDNEVAVASRATLHGNPSGDITKAKLNNVEIFVSIGGDLHASDSKD